MVTMIIANSSFFEIGFVKFVIILIIPYLKNLAEKSRFPLPAQYLYYNDPERIK